MDLGIRGIALIFLRNEIKGVRLQWNPKFCEVFEPHYEKTVFGVSKPGLTQTGQYSLPQKMARSLKFGFRNERDNTIYVVKT